jgi:hypothetical protein
MCLNPSVKREPDKGYWVVVCSCPISRDGNVQLDQGLRQHHRHAIVSDQPVDQRYAIESRYEQRPVPGGIN